jgi:DNA polymerase III subunit epsilon
MKVLITDLETSGLNPQTCEVIELGAILYDSVHQESIAYWSSLIPLKGDNLSQAVNHINISAANQLPYSGAEFERLLHESDVIAGHNFIAFDKKFFDCKDYLPNLRDKPIVDTMRAAWPKGDPKRIKLELLALDHGLPVYKAHRAIKDCQLIEGIFNSYTKDELAIILEDALAPRDLYVSLEPKPGSVSKSLGFRFNQDYPGKWAKFMTAKDAENCAVRVSKVVQTL